MNIKVNSKVTAVALTVAGLFGGGLVTASAASATTLTAPSTFDCYRGLAATINGGSLRVDKPTVAADGRVTSWFPEVFQWNASSRKWVAYGVGYVQTMSDTVLGALGDQPENFNVAANHYYAVEDFLRSSGDSATQSVWAQAMTGGAPIGSSVCLA